MQNQNPARPHAGTQIRRGPIKQTAIRIPTALAVRIDAALLQDESIRSRADWIRIMAMRRLDQLEAD